MKSLYALVADCRALELMEADADLDAETLEAVTNTLEGIKCDIQVKATGVGAYVLNAEAWAIALKEASTKLAARSQRVQRRADHMREYLRVQLAAANIKKVEAEQFTIARKANSPSVVIEPDTELPEQYLREPDPLIASVVNAVKSQQPDVAAIIDSTPPALIAEEYLLVTPEGLAGIVERLLPARAADKKAIATLLKEALKNHEVAKASAVSNKEPEPAFVNPLPGCRLEQGERLEIKP
jgi:Siphovirus Gp157